MKSLQYQIFLEYRKYKSRLRLIKSLRAQIKSLFKDLPVQFIGFHNATDVYDVALKRAMDRETYILEASEADFSTFENFLNLVDEGLVVQDPTIEGYNNWSSLGLGERQQQYRRWAIGRDPKLLEYYNDVALAVRLLDFEKKLNVVVKGSHPVLEQRMLGRKIQNMERFLNQTKKFWNKGSQSKNLFVKANYVDALIQLQKWPSDSMISRSTLRAGILQTMVAALGSV